MRGAFDKYLLANPGRRGAFEWICLLALSICSYIFKFALFPSSRALLALGAILLVLGFVIHGLSHAVHREAHRRSREISGIVTRGIYSKIRHPGYLGLILMYIGIPLIFKSWASLLVAGFFSALYVLTAFREEEILLERFGEDYESYMRRVRWRFLPYIF